MLSVRDLGIDLRDFAVSGVCFDVEDGDYFVLLGASGVGKTILLELLAGLITPDEGRVLWDGQDITHERIQHRRMGLVYQDQALFPHMTVHQNIAFGLKSRKMQQIALQERVAELAASVNVSDLLHRYPGTLSGGESQRVALARTLATQPRCLLLDEPLSSLDTQSRSDLQALLRSLHRNGHTVIHVTHEYKEAMALASRVAIMENGTITQVGTPGEVFHHPKSEFVARFVGIRNSFEGRLEHREDAALAQFVTGRLAFQVLSDACSGTGFLVFRSEDLMVSHSREDSLGQNCFPGKVVDMAPARLGAELSIDIGVIVTALVTSARLEQLNVERGKDVWISLDPSAARYIEK
jgi:ABC-type Fe3+/spermidine/putrescine transport system ATPase subunit